MKTMKTNFNAMVSKASDLGKHLTIVSIIFGALYVNAQSRIGSGDQGVQGLLAATTRQIVPGSEVVVGVPSVNENERVAVVADGKISNYQDDKKFCVLVIKEFKYGSVDTVGGNNFVCDYVGREVYIKGSANILVLFSGSLSFFEKKQDEALIIKLSKIQVPASPNLQYAEISGDFITSDLEINKTLLYKWLGGRYDSLCGDDERREICEGFKKDYKYLKSYIRILADNETALFGDTLKSVIGEVTSQGGTVYALPGVYKIKWFYKNSNFYQITTGIVLK